MIVLGLICGIILRIFIFIAAIRGINKAIDYICKRIRESDKKNSK